MSVRALEAAKRILERACEDTEAKLIQRVKTEKERDKRLEMLNEFDALSLLRQAIVERIEGEISHAE